MPTLLLAQLPGSLKKLVELVSPAVDGLFLMGKEKNCKGEKVKSLFMLFKARNIVVYGENLIHSAEKCLSEKVSNKDVQMCLNELESGFF